MTVALASAAYGGPDGAPPLVILHGLFGSGRNWATAARRLARLRRVVTVDLRNHGESPRAAGMSYGEMAGDVAAFLEAERLRPAVLLGHSMGGKVAMTLALAEPEAVAGLIVVDIAPVAGRAEHGALVRALQALPVARLASRAEADAALAPAVPDATLRGFLLQNLVRRGEGYAWRIGLEAIAAALPALGDFTADGRYDGPALFIAGGASDYLRPEHEGAIRALFPAARIERIAGAGHWVHADAPEAFLALTERFLEHAAADEVPAAGEGRR